jgi:2-dehydro-3-deoxyphosphooctonate aldolase (KDO 8-P synthase)
MENHNDSDNAMADANTVMNIKHLENGLSQVKAAHEFRLEMLEKFGEDNVHPEK